MNRSPSLRGLALPGAAIILALAAVLALVAGGALGRGLGQGGPAVTARPSIAPSTTPTPSPTAKPTAEPVDGVVKVDLDIATRHHVSVAIDDETGSLVKARSGRAAEGMSVRWYVLKVENLDAETLRLSWVGFSVDDEIELSVWRNDGKLRLRMVQAGPLPNTDSMGGDRILYLTFDEPVSADDVQATIQESLDTQD